ncbi:hypothetical protein [Lentibacillus salicampi]|uniref:Uncharacterized protein n=1 Tax=Lentibacillus salicampi TaxID=175306 RepID=A0A4Y9AAY4_9BACI|nr:hypothetical protein [Lentibacillus salicampi]TFJ92953.1 hypothetical protein E4U82_09710 [Lentibacillus salicampi]
MDRRKGITAIIGFVLLAIVVTLVVDSENTESKNADVTEHDYTFSGESEHWTADFEMEGKEVFHEEKEVLQYDSEAQSTFTLTYKGSLDELSSVEKIHFKYQTPGSSMEQTMNFDDLPPDDTTFTERGNTLVRRDEVIEITVEWGDKTEKFTLEAEE